MCGIFGIVSKSTVQPKRFRALAEENLARGNLAFGCLTADYANGSWQTTVKRFVEPFRSEMAQLGGVSTALGHIRAPTAGQTDDIAEIHPFHVDNLYLAHNGLLLNDTEFPEWRLNAAVSVDSQVILGGIYANREQGIAAAIKTTVASLEGQQACWLWDGQQAAIYLWRVMSPIYVLSDNDRFIFSSVKVRPEMALLSEGVIYCLPDGCLNLEEVGNFPYHSPYLVRK